MNTRKAEEMLLKELDNNFDSVTGSNATSLSNASNNPSFKAQFDVDIRVRYYTELAGVYTPILPAALPAALMTKVSVFIFGTSDFASGYAELKQRFPLSGWAYNRPIVFGKDVPEAAFGLWDVNVNNQLTDGDMLFPVTAVDGGTNYLAVVSITCNQVAYGTLLGSLNSDTMLMNMIRYIIEDATLTKQFANTIRLFEISLFGKTTSDSVNPNSFKMPEQFQNGIIDVPIKKGISKHVALGSYIDYDVVDFSWQIFIPAFNKI